MADDRRVIEIEDGEEFLSGFNVSEETKQDFLSQLDEQVNEHIDELNRRYIKKVANRQKSSAMKFRMGKKPFMELVDKKIPKGNRVTVDEDDSGIYWILDDKVVIAQYNKDTGIGYWYSG
jgi:hypothetical protein